VTKKLRRIFPRLFGGQYQVISHKTRRYNCTAWAAEHNDGWWEASEDGVWPADVLDDGTVAAAICLFESLGYTRTDDSAWEPGFKKVAIYKSEGGYFTHAARQLPDGRWTSKLGKGQDIEHDTLASLTGSLYGTIAQIMRKAGQAAQTQSVPANSELPQAPLHHTPPLDTIYTKQPSGRRCRLPGKPWRMGPWHAGVTREIRHLSARSG
jgi:hypothetical protein